VRLSTDQKGNIAEAAIALAAIKLGIEVYRPLGEGGRYDLIFSVGDRLLRVQCKWSPLEGDVVVIRCYSTRRGPGGLLRRVYEPGEIDAFAAYCPALGRCYSLPYDEFVRRNQVALRIHPTRNKQATGVNWAEDYDFDARLSRLGAVAQLGERPDGIREVTGSIPVGSITPAAPRPSLW
jgi:hypothetical protein